MSDDYDKSRWQPDASLDVLKVRAAVFARIRSFFQSRNVLEVDTPMLSPRAVTDPNIESVILNLQLPSGHTCDMFLATSPEYYMKRLLASGSGSIYQLSHVFRQGELGNLHQPEFMLLEWYRTDYSLKQLMLEVWELLSAIAVDYVTIPAPEFLSYQQAFKSQLDIDPLTASTENLASLARQKGLVESVPGEDSRDVYLDYLMSHCVQPRLGYSQPCFLQDYPASQAALAKLSASDPSVAERFELFINGMELANGFVELQDPVEQRKRFELDNQKREKSGQIPCQLDELFLAALEAGIPNCAGVALGIDRLILLMTGQKKLKEVLAFPVNHG